MVAALGYEAYRRSFGSTSRDQKGELQLMVQVGPLAHALFAAKYSYTTVVRKEIRFY